MEKNEVIDFVVWYSGMAKEKVINAYNRYLAENYKPETEEDYKLAQYEAKHELPPSPIETAKSELEKKDREINALKRRIDEIVYLSEQPGGYHP